MQVGRDRVWIEALGDGWDRVAETETAATVPHVQDDAFLPRLVQIGQHLALRVKPRRRAAENVGAYVAWAQFFAQELVVGPLLSEVAKVDHHPRRGLFGSRERAIDRNPFGADVVRRLDAYYHVLVFSRHARRLVGVHVVRILLVVDRGHSGAGDIDQREEPRLAAVDYPIAKILKIAPARASGIHQRRHAGAETKAVGQDAVVASPRIAVAGRGIGVDVDIYQPRRHVESAHVDDLPGTLRRQGRIYGRDYLPCNANILGRVNAVLGVDQMTALEYEIKLHGETSPRIR